MLNRDEFGRFYDAVYGQDNKPAEGEGHGWVQWKGTDACIDLHCACGHHGHVDAMFLYYYRCPSCKKGFAVGQVVKLIPLTAEQEAFVEKEHGGFKTANDAEDDVRAVPAGPVIPIPGIGTMQILQVQRGPRPTPAPAEAQKVTEKIERSIQAALADVKGEVVDAITLNKVRSKVRYALDILLPVEKAQKVTIQVTQDLVDRRKVNVGFYVNGVPVAPDFWER